MSLAAACGRDGGEEAVADVGSGAAAAGDSEAAKGMPPGELPVAVLEALAAQETHMATTNAIAKPHAQWQQASMRPQKIAKFRHRTRRRAGAAAARALAREGAAAAAVDGAGARRGRPAEQQRGVARRVQARGRVRRKTAVAALGDLRAAAAGGVPSAYPLTGGSNSSAVSPALGSSRVSHSPAPSFRAIHDAPCLVAHRRRRRCTPQPAP